MRSSDQGLLLKTALPDELAKPYGDEVGHIAAGAPVARGFDVVMVTTVHPALDIRIFHREATTLAEAGLTVCIVGRHPRSEMVEGVWIEGLSKSRSRFRRLMQGWAAFRQGRKLGGKLFIFHDPELFWVAVLLSLSGRKVVYDCHENLPQQVLQKPYIPAPLRRLLVPVIAGGEWLASRLIAGVIVAREAVQPRFPKNRTVLVRNFPKANAMRVLAEGPPVAERENIVIYAGGLSRIRGIQQLVKAFEGPELADARLLLVGEFDTPTFKSEMLASLPSNVEWVGLKTYAEVLKLYQSAKIGALLLHPTPSHRHSLPVKLFEYLGAGLLVIASDFPEFASLVEGCGELVDPADVLQIRGVLSKLLSLSPAQITVMSDVARNRVYRSLSWEPEGERLVSFCSRLLREN